MLNDDFARDETIENLRLKIFELEKELSKFGFDKRRGIESYKISELKKLIKDSTSTSEVLGILKQIVAIQEELYERLYALTGAEFKEIDTDTPEHRILKIKEMFENRVRKTEPRTETETKLNSLVKSIITIMEEFPEEECVNRVISILKSLYKRDYDRYRIIVHVLKMSGTKVDESLFTKSLREIATFLVKELKNDEKSLTRLKSISR